MPTRLQEYVITLDDLVDDDGKLIYYTFYADHKPINVIEELKDSKWMQAMMEELKCIKVNKTLSLVELPNGKKEIDMKWVYKLKLNKKG